MSRPPTTETRDLAKAAQALQASGYAPGEIRQVMAETLLDRLIGAYAKLLQDDNSETVRKTAYDLADLLDLRSRAPGGSHQPATGLSFAANLPAEAFLGLMDGMKALSKGDKNREFPEALAATGPDEAVSWRPPADQSHGRSSDTPDEAATSDSATFSGGRR